VPYVDDLERNYVSPFVILKDRFRRPQRRQIERWVAAAPLSAGLQLPARASASSARRPQAGQKLINSRVGVLLEISENRLRDLRTDCVGVHVRVGATGRYRQTQRECCEPLPHVSTSKFEAA
jgi:hypothetical protein